jgi:prefoldin alpha subunit
MDKAGSRDLQALQMYLAEYEQQAGIFARQLEILESRRVESIAATESIKYLTGTQDQVVLVPLGGGTTIRAKVMDPGRVLVNFGADVVVQRSTDEAIAFLSDRITELEAMEKKIAANLDQIRAQMNQIAQQVEMAYQEAAAGAQAKT